MTFKLNMNRNKNFYYVTTIHYKYHINGLMKAARFENKNVFSPVVVGG